MRVYLIFILLTTIILECGCTNLTDICPNIKTSLGSIRKRRHLTFPDGSNVVLTISLVKAFLTHAPAGWNLAIEIDVIYPLPDAKFTNAHFRRKLHHRQKREFWERLQNAIDSHSLNGRACVIRIICEAKSHLAPPGKSLVHDLLRAIFTAPIHDEDFSDEVRASYRELLEPNFCNQINDCPFSILDFILSINKQKY